MYCGHNANDLENVLAKWIWFVICWFANGNFDGTRPDGCWLEVSGRIGHEYKETCGGIQVDTKTIGIYLKKFKSNI